MSLRQELEDLKRLHDDGLLNAEEYAAAKAKLLSRMGEGPTGTPGAAPQATAKSGADNDGLGALNRFRRSRSDQWLGGVCAGIGRLTGMEAWIWRLIFVFMVCWAGVGVLAYLLMWIFVPLED